MRICKDSGFVDMKASVGSIVGLLKSLGQMNVT